jgi:hypothetical protein
VEFRELHAVLYHPIPSDALKLEIRRRLTHGRTNRELSGLLSPCPRPDQKRACDG